MKYKSTTVSVKTKITRGLIVMAVVLVGLIVPISSLSGIARADDYDARIKALEAEIGGYEAEASRLAGEAATLQTALNGLTAQKNIIQGQVDLSQAKYDQLIAEIKTNEKKLLQSQDVLTSIISIMVAESQASPIEILASSSTVGDYVVAQERLGSVQGQLQGSITEINSIKEELAKQKTEVERVLADQKAQRDALAAKEAEQASLVAATRGQEAEYQSMIGQKNSQIASLRAQQRAANAALGGSSIIPGDPGRGGYPNKWANAPIDSLVDSWGMYNRECVSYTAWKVHQAYGSMPYWGGRGNANQWPSSARTDGIPTGSTPRAGSVAISMSGPYGHAMWVEAVSGNQIYVSQYNYYYNGWGNYSEMWVNASGLTYIYFQ